jgi:hypothetical protein
MQDFTLTNVSRESCTVHGWPSVQLVLRSGRVITLAYGSSTTTAVGFPTIRSLRGRSD